MDAKQEPLEFVIKRAKLSLATQELVETKYGAETIESFFISRTLISSEDPALTDVSAQAIICRTFVNWYITSDLPEDLSLEKLFLAVFSIWENEAGSLYLYWFKSVAGALGILPSTTISLPSLTGVSPPRQEGIKSLTTEFINYMWGLLEDPTGAVQRDGNPPKDATQKSNLQQAMKICAWLALVCLRASVKASDRVLAFMAGERFRASTRKLIGMSHAGVIPPPIAKALESVSTTLSKGSSSFKNVIAVELAIYMSHMKDEIGAILTAGNLLHFSYDGMGLYKTLMTLGAKSKRGYLEIAKASMFAWSSSSLLTLAEYIQQYSGKAESLPEILFPWARIMDDTCLVDLSDGRNPDLSAMWCWALRCIDKTKYGDMETKVEFKNHLISSSIRRWAEKFAQTLEETPAAAGLSDEEEEDDVSERNGKPPVNRLSFVGANGVSSL